MITYISNFEKVTLLEKKEKIGYGIKNYKFKRFLIEKKFKYYMLEEDNSLVHWI